MEYTAMGIAKYVVDYCADKGKPISNLKLQKMLYYLWIEFYKETKKYLFSEHIYAWQFGPVVPDVYYEYCSYAGIPIIPMTNNCESYIVEYKEYIDSIIEKYLPYSASELVKKTHEQGKPWSIIYKNGLGNRNEIPFQLIKELECGC